MVEKLKQITRRLKKELKLYQFVLRDKRTPKLGKFFLGLAIGYLLLPFDLIPDFIPIVGHLDDIIIIPILIYLAIRFIPKEVIEDNREMLKE
jgi:uncharacterized membrane protein YkvA (DUF1232 family)